MLTKTTVGIMASEAKSRLKSHGVKPGEKKKWKNIKYIEDSDSDEYSTHASISDHSYSSYSGEPSPPKRCRKSYKGHQKKENEKQRKQKQKEFVVEDIVDVSEDANGKKFFLVKWENYDSDENTWEPLENLQKCQDIVKDFLTKRTNNTDNISESESDVNTTDEDLSDDSIPSGTTTEEINSELVDTCYPDISDIKNSMLSSFRKVIEEDLIVRETQNVSQQANIDAVEAPKCLQKVSKCLSDTYIQIPNAGDLFYIRVIDEGDGQLNWVYIDMTQPLPVPDIYYRCVVTEDLTGKQPKLVVGATTAVDGEKFCLVQFEGHSYIEVIPPDNFFNKFPSFKRFFEVHCPHLFSNDK